MKLYKQGTIKLFTLTLIFSLLLSLSACGSAEVGAGAKKFKAAGDSEAISGVVAENSKYSLIWDDTDSRIFLRDKATGAEFSTTKNETTGELDEFGLPMQPDTRMISDIIVNYVSADTNDLTTVNSSIGAVDMGHITLKAIENGIRVTYYFDAEEISVPVDYILTDKGLSVAINPKDICENKNLIYSVSLAPFACSYKNDASDSYLFIPSGSGALVYPQILSENGKTYSQEIYGTDPTTEVWEKNSNEQAVRLPVYGVKNGGNAVCAIISSGEASATVDAMYGSSNLGYSAVYPTFKLRGSTTIKKLLYGARMVSSTQYTDELIQSTCQVDFYMLSGAEADYTGMARVFRENALSELEASNATTPMNLVIYGGAEVKKSFLGVPYETLYAATTLEQAQKMITELTEQTGQSAAVMLKGFGKSGIDMGEIGGGYTVAGKLGSVSELNSLGDYCSDNGIDLYFNFDMVQQAADGWFASSDTARSTDNQTVYQYLYDKALCQRITDSRYSLISRKSLASGIDKLISKTKKWNTGIALASLSSIAYSDNSGLAYRAKDNMAADVSKMLERVCESGKGFASESANLYAAKFSDIIFGAPDSSNRNDGFSVDVPFYQMVFKGKVNLSSEAVNLSYNRSEAVLKAVEAGEGITYALSYSYDTSLTDTLYPVFISGTYESVKSGIVEEMNSLSDYYKAIGSSAIKEHLLITDEVRETVFENGASVYVNYSDSDYTGAFGTVKANSFLLKPADKD